MPTFPYAQPIGALERIISKLRSSFPERVDSDVLKKLSIAPNNESYIINTIRFLGIIDKDGARTESAQDLFVRGDDDFRDGFAAMIREAYASLFDLHADEAWNLSKPSLMTFFRTSDKSSELVGNRQAETFMRLAELAGKRAPTSSSNGDVAKVKGSGTSKKRPKRQTIDIESGNSGKNQSTVNHPNVGVAGVSLAVRIEVNLPAGADQETYDKIFQSIRANLIDRG